MRTALLVFLALAVFPPLAAEAAGPRKDCLTALEPVGPVTDIIWSGRESSDAKVFLQEASDHIDAALDLLGIPRSPHQLEFHPSGPLSHLASMGRPAVGHWYDGAVITHSSRGAMGTLEFVQPGCPTCRSFYRDSTPRNQQVEIIKHVAGHNDFSMNSIYCKMRQPCDPIAASHHLYSYMEKLRLTEDPDEISQWYQYLLTFAHSQDFARGTYSSPESLKFDPENGNTHPAAPAQELQFLVHNLPDHLPAWKKEMVRLFEQMNRLTAYVVSTKIMNEGWATFMQDFLVPYVPYKSHDYVFESASLKGGVAVPSLKGGSMPYWLGREAWRRVYKRFVALPEIKDLPRLEQDRRFYVHSNELKGQFDDYAFLRMALDKEWVEKYGLFLHRKAERNEQDQNLPPPQGPEPKEQKLVVSTDARQIIDRIARDAGDRSRQMARIHVDNARATGRGVWSLVHEVVADIPLEPVSMVEALYIRAQALERPVSLSTMAVTPVPATQGDWDWKTGQRLPPAPARIDKSPVRVEVSPDGKVGVFLPGPDGAEILDQASTKGLQEVVDDFKEVLAGSSHEELEEEQRKRFAPFIQAVADGMTDISGTNVLHDASTSTAMIRYYQAIERRLMASIRRAKRTGNFKKSKKGVRVSVLPHIPEFQLDLRKARQIEKIAGSQLVLARQQAAGRPLAPPAKDFSAIIREQAQDVALAPDPLAGLVVGGDTRIFLDIGAGRPGRAPRPGDRIWGSPEDPEQQGQGKGEGEDGDGEPGDEPGTGNQGKGAPGNPTEVEVPLEIWGEFLKEDIELPRLKPKGGPTEHMDTEREGARKHTQGELLLHRMVPKAIGVGVEVLKSQGLDPFEHDLQELMFEGMRHIQTSDWIVPDRVEVPEPDINAVVGFYIDMTGSMTGEPLRKAKELIYNVKAALSTKYKRIDYVYIGFDSEARVYKTLEALLRANLGGGTDYSSGIGKMNKILKADYPPTKWDRYSFGIGDAEDGEPQKSVKALRELAEGTEYSAFVRTDNGMNSPDRMFMAEVESLAAGEGGYFGYATLLTSDGNGLDVLRKLLGKDRKR